MKYTIVIPTHQHCDDLLKPCVESILKYTNMEDTELLIVANGCTDGTYDYLNELSARKDIVGNFIFEEKALGYTKATNLGIKAARGEYIILLNNDTILLDQQKNQWIDTLEAPFKIDKSVGITGPLKSYSPEARHEFMIFFCFMIPKRVFDDVGLLNEIYSPGAGEDTEFCIEAEKKGYRTVQVPGEQLSTANGYMTGTFPILHKAESTMLDADHAEEWYKVVERNKKKLEEKYGLPDGYFYDEDIKQYRLIMERVPENGTICELGTWKGRSLCSVADIIKRKKLKVIAVDIFTGTAIEPVMLEHAKQEDIEQIFRNNIERFGLTPYVSVNRMSTDEALKIVADHSLDLCFIDADHSYEGVKNDLNNWEPKVKRGGIISGHDYNGMAWPGVKQAVDEKYPVVNYDGYSIVWSKKLTTVLAYLNTYNRWETTLPMTILSIINQTYKPDKFIIFDDAKEPKDFRTMEHYMYLFKLMDQKGIRWEVVNGQKKGAHHNHEIANMMGFDYAWFLDDDHAAEPTCLEELMKEMKDGVGAVAGIILQPPAGPLPVNAMNIISDLNLPNIQWFTWTGPPREVEHIYSSYLHRCGIVHYNLGLSSVAFRGETMFTHSLFLKGYKLLVTPKAITWHFQALGGIHNGQKKDNWDHDEIIFRNWLLMQRRGEKFIIIDGGLGDHIVFKKVLPEIYMKHGKNNIKLAVCYPELFKDDNVMSIAYAKSIVGDSPDDSIYGWMWKNNWKGELIDAYRARYL